MSKAAHSILMFFGALLVWIMPLSAKADLIYSIKENDVIENLIEINEKSFFNTVPRAKVPLPTGRWNVRHIANVKSTHSSPINGIRIWLDKEVNQHIAEIFTLTVYESNRANWNDSCMVGVFQKLMVGGLNSECYRVDMVRSMSNNENAEQTKVKEKWNSKGLTWSISAFQFQAINFRDDFGPAFVSYSISSKLLGVDDVAKVAESKLHSSNIKKNVPPEKLERMGNLYASYFDLFKNSIFKRGETEIAVGGTTALPIFDLIVSQVAEQNSQPINNSGGAISSQSLITQSDRAKEKESNAGVDRIDGREITKNEPQQNALNPDPPPSYSVGKRVALVLGNASYKTRPLKNSRNDADDMSRSLRSSGFEVIDVRDGSLSQMRTAVRQFGDKLLTNDVGLVYYSGHGIEVKGRNYFIPVNADIQREDEIADQGLDVALILEKMNTAQRSVNIMIVDACRDDPFGRSFRSSSRGLATMEAPRGTIIAYATSPGKVASDGDPRERNSPYTKHLLRAMQAPNKPIEQVFKEVRRAVQDETKNQQTPWENTSLSGDFYFKVVR
jgi:hypothetical protein